MQKHELKITMEIRATPASVAGGRAKNGSGRVAARLELWADPRQRPLTGLPHSA